MKMCSNTYISTNCNQTPTIADWGNNNLICYGSCNAVYVYNPTLGSGGKIIHTLVAHKKRVNTVKWISGPLSSYETELISGSTDSNMIVWSLREDNYIPQVLKGHESNVNIVDGVYRGPKNDNTFIVSASMDSTIRIWFRPKVDDVFESYQVLNLGYNICISLKVYLLPNTNSLIMACSMDNCSIQLYINEGTHNKFQKSVTLKGHEDWVRGLDFTNEGEDLFLASSSQDAFIRLWRITKTNENKRSNILINDNDDISQWDIIKTSKQDYRVYLESLLMGHEGWIYSVNWNPKNNQLLSASLDKTMIIWEHDPVSGFWLEKIRVGNIGGNTLGFYGGMFGPDGNKILAHGYQGAFHIWGYENKTQTWNPMVTIGGHFNQVIDLDWEPEGEYVISVSTDQTSRIHAPWPTSNFPVTWHEIARPQVHGYDMSSVAILSKYKFASSSEEKVIRTFEAPKNFVDNFRRICKITNDKESDILESSTDYGPKGASVPSLGLSNKAVYTEDNSEQCQLKNKEMYPEESYFTATDMTEPPTEETLLQNTLWPEIQKLYGHGYEVYCLAASPDGKYLASACKSTTPQHATVLIWDTSTWTLIKKLASHTLTVAQISFSPDSANILTVSRDRRWSLFEKNKDQEFELVATTDKKTSIHTRIIWCSAWTHDSKYFATGSRDGKVAVWNKNENKTKETVLGQYEAVSSHLALPDESITALAFAPGPITDKYLLAVGLETGSILLYKWSPLEWNRVLQLDHRIAHHLTVKRIRFRPVLGRAGYKDIDKNILQMSSCSADYSVKIYDIFIDKI